MLVIIIKWSVMTTDNPLYAAEHPGLAERHLFVNAPLKPKTHADVCVGEAGGGQNHKTEPRALSLFRCTLLFNFY